MRGQHENRRRAIFDQYGQNVLTTNVYENARSTDAELHR